MPTVPPLPRMIFCRAASPASSSALFVHPAASNRHSKTAHNTDSFFFMLYSSILSAIFFSPFIHRTADFPAGCAYAFFPGFPFLFLR